MKESLMPHSPEETPKQDPQERQLPAFPKERVLRKPQELAPDQAAEELAAIERALEAERDALQKEGVGPKDREA